MTALAYDDAGSGTPLLLLHAFPLSRRMWRHQHDALSADMRVIAPDLPGFGDSPPAAGEPDLGVMADAVLDLVDDLGLDRVVLGGLSMGGYVAMQILRRRPQVVRALVLADTKASADPEEGVANRHRMAALLEQEENPRVLVHDVLPTLLADATRTERPDTVDWLRDLVASADPRGAAWAQRAMAARPDSFATLRRTEVPALVLVGSDDRLSPPHDAEAMAEALPHGRLRVLDGAGHLSAAEDPETFNAQVADFVRDLG